MSQGFIFTDIAGTELTQEDREILTHPAVAGVVLFAKNFAHKNQLEGLIKQLRQINDRFIISVDQEGGRVQRFQEGFTPLPSMRYWGERFDKEGEGVFKDFTDTIKTMTNELQNVGVNTNLVPVLDIDYGVSHVIGERSFNRNPNTIVTLANKLIETMHQNHMPVTGKHFPGHGGVIVDSHKGLPVDERPWETLWESDIKPFRELSRKLDAVMPAHVIYEKVDSKPAGFSSRWLREILRQQFDFKGVIITDDLTMNAAATLGNYENRAGIALEAGCDILTLCNNRAGLVEVLDCFANYSDSQSEERIRNYVRFAE